MNIQEIRDNTTVKIVIKNNIGSTSNHFPILYVRDELNATIGSEKSDAYAAGLPIGIVIAIITSIIIFVVLIVIAVLIKRRSECVDYTEKNHRVDLDEIPDCKLPMISGNIHQARNDDDNEIRIL